MKEHPILFSGPMVQAILEGKKTVTRRVVKFPPHTYTPDLSWVASVNQDGQGDWVAWGPKSVTDDFSKKAYPNGGGFSCPYGKPGDSLWVRETWQAQTQNGQWWHEVKAERELYNWAWTNPVEPAFEATPPRWLPSIHMPRAASRITLKITGVRTERLQDISEADAIAEGIKQGSNGFWLPGGYDNAPALAYRDLWDSINGKRPGCDWQSNPWVWVLEFEVSR